MKELTYDEYLKDLHESADDINLDKAIKSQRTGGAKFRDNLVLGKAFWSEALTYFAVIQSAIIFLGLMDDVVDNLNTVLRDICNFIGISVYQFPVNVTSYIAIAFIVFIFCFGLVGYKYLGLPRRTAEIGSSVSPAHYMIWKRQQIIMNRWEEDGKEKESKKGQNL